MEKQPTGIKFAPKIIPDLGQNTLSVRSSTACFFFSLKTSISEEMGLIIYGLKFSRRFPISARVAPPLDE